MAAACALVQMATHGGGAAPLDGNQYLRCSQVNQAGRRSVNRWPAAPTRSANSRSGRFILLTRCALWVRRRCEHERVERAGGGTQMAL
jgi:hypothetical protein